MGIYEDILHDDDQHEAQVTAARNFSAAQANLEDAKRVAEKVTMKLDYYRKSKGSWQRMQNQS